jgi:allophanate hydrolase subunit 2
MISARAGTTIAIDTWRPRRCDPGDTLAVGALAGGARMYVCVAGGVQSTITLASRSTQVSTSAGGVGGLAPSGRHAGVGTPLSAGDIIPTADHPAPTTFRDLPDTAREFIERTITRAALRIVPGPQSHTLPNSVRDRIASIPFQVSSHSNRTGLRLAGTPFIAGASPSMLTQPVAHGFIQLTPANELIILGPDAPPTGGYPVIASVISADLPRAGQCFPGETVTLEWTTIERARRLIHDQMETFDALLPPA